jgi:hypothetical protein
VPALAWEVFSEWAGGSDVYQGAPTLLPQYHPCRLSALAGRRGFFFSASAIAATCEYKKEDPSLGQHWGQVASHEGGMGSEDLSDPRTFRPRMSRSSRELAVAARQCQP